jgi:hypothetical protein
VSATTTPPIPYRAANARAMNRRESLRLNGSSIIQIGTLYMGSWLVRFSAVASLTG